MGSVGGEEEAGSECLAGSGYATVICMEIRSTVGSEAGNVKLFRQPRLVAKGS
jgi:hypothetical protein